MISQEFRDWLNQKVLDYLPHDRIVQGDKILFRCPICGDSKRNSMKKRGYWYTRNASFHCFNCDANMNGMKFLEILSGEDYLSLREEYFRMMFDGRHFGSISEPSFCDRKPKNGILSLKSIVKPSWKKPLSERAREYLANRKVLDAPFLKEEFFSYFSKRGDEYIFIPWKINGIECYFQLNDFMRVGKMGLKYIFPKNTDKLIYGLDNVDISFPYVICFEGVYDSLFVRNGVAIGGKSLTEKQEEIIRKRFPRHRIAISFDNDKPGIEAMSRALSSGRSFSFFKWFSDGERCKDVNDYILKTGKIDAFSDRRTVEDMVMDRLPMKLWLSNSTIIKKNNCISSENDKDSQIRPPWEIQ